MNSSKLAQLIEIEGYNELDEFLEDFSIHSVVPGICMNPECDYIVDVEPDCIDEYCEECGTQTVKSALILAGVI